MQALKKLGRYLVLTGLVLLVAIPASSAERSDQAAGLAHYSQIVQLRYFLAHPDKAPQTLARTIDTMRGLHATAGRATAEPQPGAYIRDLFNNDGLGLPQNEEAVSVCDTHPSIVVGGTNDYRGLVDPEGNFTGWQLSTDGGKSVAKEGLLPSLPSQGENLPSGGDPVVQSRDGCTFYFGSINYPADDPFNGPNGIAVYKTNAATLRSCAGGTEPDELTTPDCVQTGRIVAEAQMTEGAGHFLDKEWLDIGESGSAGRVVWIVYSDFTQDPDAPLGFTGAQIKAVRCSADLSDCTDPILISGADEDVQFGDVTIAEDGSVLVTWAQIEGELEQTAQTFTIKSRIAAPGTTTFGPTSVVAAESNPLPFGGFLHAADFRVATYPKSIMPMVNGQRRPFVVWDRCKFLVLDNVCEGAQIQMSWSADGGTTWVDPVVISERGDNFFPAISDEGTGRFAVSYYTTRYDPIFHHDYDVEAVRVNRVTGDVVGRQRVTPFSNDPDADPVLGGFFIGDYFDVHLLGGRMWVHYNANVRHVRVLDEGAPIPQQDNYLTRVGS